ncbi:THAP domain-containing protein 4 [Elysia marginata]|uniref:THAP domain-containing protein 4 n=1 Tax=Elysia marginata TaxID=1093978 RepID=A0AAV4EFF5_9GAST|nr:THAP domain-containing protein 4 [Elysia marginata]
MEKTRRRSKYCCAINCSNNSATSIDPRTHKSVRFHRFPDPDKERERCSRWIVNLRRSDLNLSNVKHKVVCSLHFETTAYNCPEEIATSRLLPASVPTLINCPNPPPSMTPKRPPPKNRHVSEFHHLYCRFGNS